MYLNINDVQKYHSFNKLIFAKEIMSILICASDTQFSEIAEDSRHLQMICTEFILSKGFVRLPGLMPFFSECGHEDIHRIDFNDQPVFLNEVARTSEEPPRLKILG